MYTQEEYKEFLILVAKWAGGYEAWRQKRNRPRVQRIEWVAGTNEYRVFTDGAGLAPGYSDLFSHKVTQQDINMYLIEQTKWRN